MRLFVRPLIAASLFVATFARAGDPSDFLQGYGKARWGQTCDEVQQLYGDKIKDVVGYQSGLGADRSLPEEVNVIDMKLSNPEPLVGLVVFRFLQNRLCAVEITLSSEAQAVTTNQTLARVIWDKYYADPVVRAQFSQHHLLVWLSLTGRKPEPQGPTDLLPRDNILSSVWYENRELWDQQVAKAGEQRREKTEQAKRAATEAKLKEAL